MALILSKELPYINQLIANGIDVVFKENYIGEKELSVAILNLMPAKIETELQLLNSIGHSKKYVWVDFIYTKTHKPTHVSETYLNNFYTTFSSTEFSKYHGLIITGAPVEKMDFTEVNYWNELEEIMNFAYKNIKSTLYICWGAQAALYHFYNINKHPLEKKAFGVFSHKIINPNPLVQGIKDEFYAPHSRHTYIDRNDVLQVSDLSILSDSTEVGPFSITSKDYRNVLFLGHIEYDKEVLKKEYFRDLSKGLPINVPDNYFEKNDPMLDVKELWKKPRTLLFLNWINLL